MWPQILSAITNIFLSVAAIVTATCAYRGLGTWKREIEGRTKHDAALGMYKACRRLKYAAYAAHKLPPINISGKREDWQRWARSNENQWKIVLDKLGDFDEALVAVEVLVPAVIIERGDRVRREVEKMYSESDMRNDLMLDEVEQGPQDKGTHETIVFRQPSRDDKTLRELNAALASVEDLVRPLIKGSLQGTK